MKKLLLIYSMGATLLLIVCIATLYRTHHEVNRLRNNNEALSTECSLYKTRLDNSAASVVAMQLQLDEFREQHSRDLKQIKALGVRLRRVESVATTATRNEVRYA